MQLYLHAYCMSLIILSKKESSNTYSSYSGTQDCCAIIHILFTGSAETRNRWIKVCPILPEIFMFDIPKEPRLENEMIRRKPILKRPAPPWCYAVSKKHLAPCWILGSYCIIPGSRHLQFVISYTLLGTSISHPKAPLEQHRCQIQHQEKHQPGFAKTYLQKMEVSSYKEECR